MYTDPSGEGLFIIIAILTAFTIAGGVAGGVISYNNGDRGWDVVKNVVLGASIGLATGGAIVSVGAVGAGALHALNIGAGTFLGVAAKQAFAIGALAFDFTAFVIAPIYGFSMQGIEYETPKPVPGIEKPKPTPPHPYTRGWRNGGRVK